MVSSIHRIEPQAIYASSSDGGEFLLHACSCSRLYVPCTRRVIYFYHLYLPRSLPETYTIYTNMRVLQLLTLHPAC